MGVMTTNDMQVFDRSCLIYKYKWDSRKELTLVTKTTLDRTNGYEVLYFINTFFRVYNLGSMITFKRAEFLLYNHLPINIKNRSEITSWLLKYWNQDFYS
ncbi:hypothetical protein [Flavobacterium psychrotrophum]|uniref:hypothetical protein n=1 Tax=Flavobacterium psychrotrophum TaxID=2294119 RepID=UPI0013C41258|nr:hypothetical protein [Flavobacterium psychrotrophum]